MARRRKGRHHGRGVDDAGERGGSASSMDARGSHDPATRSARGRAAEEWDEDRLERGPNRDDYPEWT